MRLEIKVTDGDWEILNTFVQQIEQWAKEQNWQVEKERFDLHWKDIPIESMRLEVAIDEERSVSFTPRGIGILDHTLRVEMIAWPSLRRVYLVKNLSKNRKDEFWEVLTDSGIKLREPLDSSSAFLSLVNDLTA